MAFYTDKTLLITGGTGSFGNAVLERFCNTDIGEIRIFSRDEKKQDDLRHQLQKTNAAFAQKVKFYLGDVRDFSSVRNAMYGVNIVFHAAALKQVPSCEFFPIEAVKTNVLGAENVLSAAIDEKVESVVCLSTDKAVYPANAMGLSKAMMEKVAIAKSQMTDRTKICCTRYGNVLCSRGSVVPLWMEQIREGSPLTLTDPEMTRFIMTLEEAVDLVLYAMEQGKTGDVLVQKAPACTLQTLARAVCKLMGAAPRYETIGIRQGEKMHETLVAFEELSRAEESEKFFRVPKDRNNLDYAPFFTDGMVGGALVDFRSDNTRQLNEQEVIETLRQTAFIKKVLEKN